MHKNMNQQQIADWIQVQIEAVTTLQEVPEKESIAERALRMQALSAAIDGLRGLNSILDSWKATAKKCEPQLPKFSVLGGK